jgi:hypothetical protein
LGFLPSTPCVKLLAARTVADLVLFDAALTTEASALPRRLLTGVRLSLAPAFFWARLTRQPAVVLQRALEKPQAAGATVVEADVPATVVAATGIWGTIIAAELEPSIERFLAQQGAGVNFRQLIAQTDAIAAALFSHLLSRVVRDTLRPLQSMACNLSPEWHAQTMLPIQPASRRRATRHRRATT